MPTSCMAVVVRPDPRIPMMPGRSEGGKLVPDSRNAFDMISCTVQTGGTIHVVRYVVAENFQYVVCLTKT